MFIFFISDFVRTFLNHAKTPVHFQGGLKLPPHNAIASAMFTLPDFKKIHTIFLE